VVEEAVAQTAHAVRLWVRQGIDVCTNQVNVEPKPEKPKKEKLAREPKDAKPADSEKPKPNTET